MNVGAQEMDEQFEGNFSCYADPLKAKFRFIVPPPLKAAKLFIKFGPVTRSWSCLRSAYFLKHRQCG